MRVLNVEGDSVPLASGVPSSHDLPDYSNGYGAPLSRRSETWRPSKKAIIWTSVGLAVVAALVFGLVFGLDGGGDGGSTDVSGSGSTGPLSAGCSQLIEGNFTDFLQPNLYEIAFDFKAEHFDVQPSSPTYAAVPPPFAATTAITFNVTKPTSCVVLHSQDLAYSAITVSVDSSADPVTLCADADACADVVAPVNIETPMSSVQQNLVAVDLSSAGVALGPEASPRLVFTYTGLTYPAPNATGLHRSAPFLACDSNGCVAKAMIATQLERTGARKVFPSYDMPASKAKFIVTVTAPFGAAPVILSNTQEEGSVASADATARTITFEPTPRMSPYLVAIAAGHLTKVEGVDSVQGSTYTVTGYTAPGREEWFKDAVRRGQAALQYYADRYNQVDQPIKDYSFVAIPGKTFAMENWGLLMFDEARSFYNTSSSGAYGRVRLASVVCHEVAHQWLGNLATCEDWTQLSVNEGLTSQEEYACMSHVDPALPGDVLRYRILTPGNDIPSNHDGPLWLALAWGADPMQPPMAPVSDLQLAEFGVERMVYAKGTGLYLLMQFAADVLMGKLGKFWRPGLNTLLKKHAYSTMVYSDVLQAMIDNVKPVFDEKVGPGKEFAEAPWANGFIMRTAQIRAGGGNLALERQLGSNGSAPVGSWVYTPSYPYIDTTIPNIINPTNYSATLQMIGGNQTRYCPWNGTVDELKAAGYSDDAVVRLQTACYNPAKFVTTIVMHNVTDCSANKTADIPTISGPADFGAVAADRWVLNQNSVRLWRTKYSSTHFNNLVEETGSAPACPTGTDTTNVAVGSDDVCCAAAGDMLEMAGVLADAVNFGQDGKYPADWALRMATAAANSPAASTGAGHYVLLYMALETAEWMEGYSYGNATCEANYAAWKQSLVEPHAAEILANALSGEGVRAMNAGGASTPEERERFLDILAENALLRYIGLNMGNVTAPADGKNATAGDDGRRRRLQQAGDAPEDAPTGGADTAADPPAPAEGDADGQGDAAAPSPADYNNDEYGDGTADYGDGPAAAPGPGAEDTTAAPTPAANDTAAAPPTPAPAPPAAASETYEERLCSMLLETPFWHRYVARDAKEYDAAFPVEPYTAVPVNMLAAVYGLAAGMAPGCRAVLEGPYASTPMSDEEGAADVAAGVRRALLQCWLYDSVYAEASRCAFAMAWTLDPYALVTLVPLAAPTAEQAVVASSRLPMYYSTIRPWILGTMMRLSPATYVNILEGLGSGNLWAALGGDLVGCALLNLVPPPTNSVQINALNALLDGRAAGCPSVARGRAIGRKMASEAILPTANEQICGYLESWAAQQQ